MLSCNKHTFGVQGLLLRSSGRRRERQCAIADQHTSWLGCSRQGRGFHEGRKPSPRSAVAGRPSSGAPSSSAATWRRRRRHNRARSAGLSRQQRTKCVSSRARSCCREARRTCRSIKAQGSCASRRRRSCCAKGAAGEPFRVSFAKLSEREKHLAFVRILLVTAQSPHQN